MTTFTSTLCYGRINCPGINAAAMQFKLRCDAILYADVSI